MTVVLYEGFLSPQEVEQFSLRAEAELSNRPTVMRSRSRVRRWGPWIWSFRRPHPTPKDMGPMPEWVRELRDRADEVVGRTGPADSATLSEFPPGAALSPHVDSPAFEDEIAAVSVGPGRLILYSAAPETFVNQAGVSPGEVRREVVIPTGSLYVMLRPAVHSVAAGASTRVSLTFRKVRT